MLCNKCGSDTHEERDCGAIGAGTGAPGTGPDDSDLDPLGGGGTGRSRRKTVLGAIIGLAVVGAIAGVIALRSGGDKAAKAVAMATAAPTGDTIELACSIPSVDAEEVEARCDWARDGGVVFDGLRWDGDVLKGVLTVTLTDGRVYASKEMEVKVRKTKTPVALAAR